MNKVASEIAPVLSRSILGGEFTVEQVVERAGRTLGVPWPWLRPMAARCVAKYAGRSRPRCRELIAFLERDRGFRLACTKYADQLVVAQRISEPSKMSPAEGTKAWALPGIHSAGELADWLELETGELEWFADLKTLSSQEGSRLSHYRYRVLKKQWGTVRLIEAPKPRLKLLQRRILVEVLNAVPPHAAAHGFVRGRGIQSFAAPHAEQAVVLKMDLSDFFPSFSVARIQAFFRTAGYPEPVADLLGGICTTAAPVAVWGEHRDGISAAQLAAARELYRRRHLPQGAPTSPELANICAYRLDCRLAGLARAAGATYTRYADDLAFSGDEKFERCCERFSSHVAAILLEEGFQPHYRKTRIMRRSVRQQLAGLVVNQRINVARRDFDLLKAILTNCIRLSPESQNRDNHPDFHSHLEGRIGFVESINPEKGARLWRLFRTVQWN